MVTLDDLVRCCGPSSRFLKSYQVLGVNFMLLLARAGVGGCIMSDEMVRGARLAWPSLKPIGCSWSYLSCRTGHSVPA
jgi:hypothetical protein